MSSSFYPLASSTWGESEFSALERVIRSGNFTMGKEVEQFEQNFAAKVGSSYAVMTNSGSSANLVMMAAARYSKYSKLVDNDVVIAPAVSWSTTYYPIHQLGFSISMVDIDLETLNIDTQAVQEAITSRTRAILAVNLLGNPADLITLREIASANNLLLFEDNCESLGASINGKQAGTFGTAGSYSCFFSHHISTMEGGLTVTDDLSFYQAMKSLRAHGWTRDLPKENLVYNKSGSEWEDLFRFVLPGYNLRPLELEGALGLSQLLKLNEFVLQRRENAEFLLEQSHNFPRIKLQRENGNSSWFGFSLVLTGGLEGKREFLLKDLASAGIESRPIVAGNFARNPVMNHLRHEKIPSLPNADFIHKNGLFVGNHHYSMRPQLNRLVEVLMTFEESYG